MGSFKLAFQRQYRYIVAAAALLLAVVMPAIVAAEQVTDRSIQLSNSSADMDGVSYEVKFTAVGAAQAFVIEFCDNSPLIGQACDAPVGMNASAAATATSGYAVVGGSTTANKITATKTITADEDLSVIFTGINNPTNAGPLYARIVTYSDASAANTYTSTNLDPGSTDTVVDQGSVALSITDTVGVSGAVLETMTFCVAGAAISADCGDAASNPPVLALGEGNPKALSTSAVSSGNIYAQISTNAAKGAVVRLKSDATGCGGLLLTGGTGCHIAPQNDEGQVADFAANNALFGLKAAGAGNFVAAGDYNNTRYFINYVSGDATGVTSVYGDPVLNTSGGPINNANATLTFGAGITNTTPAGLYATDLSLIATGTF